MAKSRLDVLRAGTRRACPTLGRRLAGRPGEVKRDVPEFSGRLVVIYATELEAIEAKIAPAGGKIVRKTYPFPGGRRFRFSDPSGNELAVWTDR